MNYDLKNIITVFIHIYIFILLNCYARPSLVSIGLEFYQKKKKNVWWLVEELG